jgi:TPR repeat protein
MPDDEKVPATVPINSTLPQVQSDGLVARGLLAVRQSLADLEKENAESLFTKGMRFRYGEDGVPQDSERARIYLSAAAKLDHAEAQFELCVFLGEYGEWPEAIGWLEKSVSLGFGIAKRYLADGLSDGLITEHLNKDDYRESQLYRQAEAWYEQRASSGDAEVQYGFASWLNDPDCPMHNRVRAMRWMRAAAQQRHGIACRRFGELLLEAEGPEHSTEQGIYWLSRAAELNDSFACKALGNLYLLGHAGGRYARGRAPQIVVPDKRQAVSWYERQIELEKLRGSFLGTHALARLFLDGEHLDQDLVLAERMLLGAGSAGNLDSQRLLASESLSRNGGGMTGGLGSRGRS